MVRYRKSCDILLSNIVLPLKKSKVDLCKGVVVRDRVTCDAFLSTPSLTCLHATPFSNWIVAFRIPPFLLHRLYVSILFLFSTFTLEFKSLQYFPVPLTFMCTLLLNFVDIFYLYKTSSQALHHARLGLWHRAAAARAVS